MIKLIIYITLLILVSCASNKNSDFVDSANDDLRSESLSRKKIQKENKPFSSYLLSSCYKESSFDIKKYSRKKLDVLKESFSYWSSMGSCYLHQEKVQKALFFYKISLSKVKNETQKAIYLNNLGVYYTKINRLNMAINMFHDSIAIDRKYKTPHMNLAMIYAQYGLNKKARIQLSHFQGSNDPHILYIQKIVSSSKDVIGYFPGYITEEEKEDTLNKITKD